MNSKSSDDGGFGKFLNILNTILEFGNIITHAVINIILRSKIIVWFFKYHNSMSVLYGAIFSL